MAADAMRHYGLAARGAAAGVYGAKRIMRASHIFSVRGSRLLATEFAK